MKEIKVTSLDAEEVKLYTKLNEKQIKRIFEPEIGAFICESTRVIERAIAAGYEPLSFFIEEGMQAEVEDLNLLEDISVYVAEHDVMREITGYSLTGGVLCAMRRKPQTDLKAFLSNHKKLVILDDVENPTNVGAVFRSAAALGADGVILTPGSADPLYRRAARVSMGTVFQIDWSYADDDWMSLLKEEGYETIAFALSDDSVALNEYKKNEKKKAVILGNEDHGISEDTLAACDCTIMIPMQRGVDSLNVAAASAVAFWEIFG